jgi:hypothetical protein
MINVKRILNNKKRGYYFEYIHYTYSRHGVLLNTLKKPAGWCRFFYEIILIPGIIFLNG